VARARAASWQIERPAGVALTFQVVENNVEPRDAISTRNLFAKDDVRSALRDEPKPRRPKMARIGGRSAAPRLRERLTGATPGPDGLVVWPSSESQGVAPSTDTGEEMALAEPSQVVGPNIGN
jgi:hypothetical protein